MPAMSNDRMLSIPRRAGTTADVRPGDEVPDDVRVRYQRADAEPRSKAFLEALLTVCREHGLSLAHEDAQGAFIVRKLNQADEACLLSALTPKA